MVLTLTCVMLASGLSVVAQPGVAGASAGGASGSGYWMLGYDGTVYPFGSARLCQNVFGGSNLDVFIPNSYGADIVPTPDGLGYWALDGENYVDFFKCSNMPDADYLQYEHNNFFADKLAPNEVPTSMSALPDGSGYWVFTNLGRAIPFGNAQWYGDMGNVHLNGPVLGSVATPTGHGYYMVASDGGIFTFGDAHFHGSMGGARLNKPVMSMAPTPNGRGYWLVASDGGIFAFSAPFHGSMGSVRLNRPVVGMVASPTGNGYLMVGSDGGIFTFGDVPFHGSLGSNPPFWPITSVAVMP